MAFVRDVNRKRTLKIFTFNGKFLSTYHLVFKSFPLIPNLFLRKILIGQRRLNKKTIKGHKIQTPQLELDLSGVRMHNIA